MPKRYSTGIKSINNFNTFNFPLMLTTILTTQSKFSIAIPLSQHAWMLQVQPFVELVKPLISGSIMPIWLQMVEKSKQRDPTCLNVYPLAWLKLYCSMILKNLVYYCCIITTEYHTADKISGQILLT